MTTLSDDELDRYARHIVLPQVGGVGQRRLKAASVAIIGAGGIGSAAIPALAGAGVGKLTIIDDGEVERSNLQRQPLFRDDEIGKPKARLAADFAHALNPNVDSVPVQQRLDSANVERLIGGHDVILDGSDNFATRLTVSDACVGLGIPLVSAAAVQFQGQVGLFRSKPCFSAAAGQFQGQIALFRGWEQSQPCYRCFVGDAFDSDDCDTCAEQGVLGALSATVGSFGALMAIRTIVGIGDDVAGTLYLLDGAALEWRTIRLPKDRACRAC